MPVKSSEVVPDPEQQSRALAIVNALHDAGWRNLWLESEAIFSGGYGSGTPQTTTFMLKVIIPDDRVDGKRMDDINRIAEEHNAVVYLDELRLNQKAFSRVCIWAKRKDRSDE